MRLLLARHGETEWNRLRRIQGISDLELNETGRRQAEALARDLSNLSVYAVYTSPLKRARDTARLIAEPHGLEVITLDGLREMDAGEVDGLTYQEMRTHYRDFFEKWMQDCSTVRPPGGCTLEEIQEQAWSAVQEMQARHEQDSPEANSKGDGVTIAVTHFFPILSILCKALGLDLSECRRMRLDVASTCTLELRDSGAILVSMNNTCHLKEYLP
jgi:broad specificity phosphatase PhoE